MWCHLTRAAFHFTGTNSFGFGFNVDFFTWQQGEDDVQRRNWLKIGWPNLPNPAWSLTWTWCRTLPGWTWTSHWHPSCRVRENCEGPRSYWVTTALPGWRSGCQWSTLDREDLLPPPSSSLCFQTASTASLQKRGETTETPETVKSEGLTVQKKKLFTCELPSTSRAGEELQPEERCSKFTSLTARMTQEQYRSPANTFRKKPKHKMFNNNKCLEALNFWQ